MGVVERFLESIFESVGRKVGRHPVKSLIGSVVFVVLCGGGFAFLKSETRPEKQWVPAGSLALDHNEYVSSTWPGNARINLFSATCADVDESSCNILDPKYIQRFHEINQRILNITIDGDALVEQLDADHKRSVGDNRPWTIYAGDWNFNGRPKSVDGSVVFEGRKCFAFGPFCGKQSVLDVFRDDDYIISNLDDRAVKQALNNWEDQETFCPLTLAFDYSPCYNQTCQKYKTTEERLTCRAEASSYCAQRCPTRTIVTADGEEATIPLNMETCEESATPTVIERVLESFFEKVGRVVGTHPVKSLVCSVLFVVACGGGFSFLTNETRPEKQWVPAGSLALDHNEYVQQTFPSNSRFNLFTATCNDVEEADCNIFDPKYIKRFHQINERIMNISIDGDEIVADLDKAHKRGEGDRRPWLQYQGQWSFMGSPENVNGSVVFNGRKCFSFGPFCGKQSILDVFKDDDYIIRTLTAEGARMAINEWEDQENFCPLTIAVDNSPCFNSNCQKYDTVQERSDCRTLARSYCATSCPDPRNMDTCKDRGCLTLGSFEAVEAENQLNTDPNETGQAPESAFEFQPTKIKTMVGGLVLDDTQQYVGGKHLSGFFALNKAELFCPSQGTADPVADEWERRALCLMGVDADPRAEPKLECPEDDLLKFNGLFQRSFGDEFGNAIRGDIAKLTSSYAVIIVYCAIMIGKCDAIHSGVAMSFVAVLIVGLTIASTLGLMGYFGVPNGNLNNNLYFLLLGLGVDDAFVLSSEYARHSQENKELSIPDRIAATARTGGISVLITSATDALAFLVGATTVLPALGWFCTYAGVSIVLCYTYQLTVFLPCLALNARRVEANRIDCCCCCRLPERSPEDPQGCCCCCLPRQAFQGGVLKRGLKGFMERVTTPMGQIITIVLFAALTAGGIFGTTKIYKDFKLEWFIPDSSYVNQFFDVNNMYFATGTPITINMRASPDAFEVQEGLHELFGYLNTTELINHDVGVDSWYQEFMEWAVDPNQAATASATFTPSRTAAIARFADRPAFYGALHTWYRGTTGSRYRGSLLWASEACNVDGSVEVIPTGCDVAGGLRASRFNAELSLAATDKGTNRYTTMESMRKKVDELVSGAFPYSFDFLYWEEVGVIDTELVRNLMVCGGVILVVIFALVPYPRIAIWVVLCVALSIVDTLGFMYFWDVTISGVSTIYVLICVGLAVDYAAHIAHMFKESTGSPRERAIAAAERIGPCTFNAVLSTLLAVVVVGFSESYVFRIFFKVLFLVVTIAGAHGLWLLPAILSICGGSKDPVGFSAGARPAREKE